MDENGERKRRSFSGKTKAAVQEKIPERYYVKRDQEQPEKYNKQKNAADRSETL